MDKKRDQIIQNTKQFCENEPSPFESNDDILEKASWIFEIRSALTNRGYMAIVGKRSVRITEEALEEYIRNSAMRSAG